MTPADEWAELEALARRASMRPYPPRQWLKDFTEAANPSTILKLIEAARQKPHHTEGDGA